MRRRALSSFLRRSTCAALGLALGGTLLACNAGSSGDAISASAAPPARTPDLTISGVIQPDGVAGLPAGMSWTGWSPLSGGLTSDPSIVGFGPLAFNLVATGPDGAIWSNWFTGTSWIGWTRLGNAGKAITLAPSSVVDGNDIVVFAIDSAGTLLAKYGQVSGNASPIWASSWQAISPPNSLTVAPNGPPTVVVSQPSNQVNVFVTMSDQSVAVASGIGGFYRWSLLGEQVLYQPGAVSWGTNRLDVFAVDTGHALAHRYSNDNGQTWGPAGNTWEHLQGNAYTTPQVVSWGPERIDVFLGGYPKGVPSIDHLAWTGGGWGTCSAQPCWDILPGAVWGDGPQNIASPTPITLGSGQMEVFVQGQSRALETYSMTADATATTPPQWSTGTVASCFRNAGKPAVTIDNGDGFALAMTAFDPSGDASVWTNSTSWPFPASGSPPTCSYGGLGAACDPTSSNPDVSTCQTGASCQNDVCTACGGYGQRVCPGAACASPFVAPFGKCECAPNSSYDGTTCTAATGIFWPADNWGGTSLPGMVVGDVNGDGKGDLANLTTSGAWVSLSDGSAGFGSTQVASSSPFAGTYGTTLADVNGDGCADAVSFDGDTYVMVSNCCAKGTNCANAFGPPQLASSTPFHGTYGTVMADVNGDGCSDAVSFDGSTYVMLSNCCAKGTNCTNAFGPVQLASSTPFHGRYNTAMADVNGDGCSDAVSLDGDTFVMLSNCCAKGTNCANALGTVQTWSTTPFSGSNGTLAGDVNGDGRADAVAFSANTYVMLSNGVNGFGAPQLWSGTPLTSPVLADVTGDKRADAVGTDTFDGQLDVMVSHQDCAGGLVSADPNYGAPVAQRCLSACGNAGEYPCTTGPVRIQNNEETGGCTQWDTVIMPGSSICQLNPNCGHLNQGACDSGNIFQSPDPTTDVCNDGSSATWEWPGWTCVIPDNGGNPTGPCANGLAPPTEDVCVTCPSMSSFTTHSVECTMDAAVAEVRFEYEVCTVTANACAGD